ncbi:MAG: flavodoxin-dependent (E)-4-hydroxy-3-methylbut-2-enyl-diphosphate synthase [Oscillospiraceae bacterium]|nr:flavodoxin-dependent (E)-4-hydroxy-3-methylbut-2-enyl-diphosphate synthase [Oscillospiraceae bacterium]
MDSRQILVGGVAVGGGAPVSVQSMTNTKTEDVESTVAQILRLEEAGCDIVRVAIPNMEAAEAVEAIRERIHIPLVADIHFDYRLAVACAERGADKIRINPGNIGGEERVKAVVEVCRSRNIPIRIGVNGGSLEPALLEKYGGPTPEAMTESAMGHVKLLNRFGFDDICISVKASDVPLTVKAYRLLRQMTDYPLHLGVTEAGTEYAGLVKSAVGIGTLLSEGIGDTIRVSLTAPPEREVTAGIAILKAAGLRKGGVEFISCPSCGRCRIDLIGVASEAERRLRNVRRDITVAVMGCAVNGPGEASRADFGIAGGDGEGVLFRKGQIVKKVPNDRLVDELMMLIESTPEEEMRKEERG